MAEIGHGVVDTEQVYFLAQHDVLLVVVQVVSVVMQSVHGQVAGYVAENVQLLVVQLLEQSLPVVQQLDD